MKKTQEYADALTRDFAKLINRKPLPTFLSQKMEGKKEAFSASYGGGILTLKSTTPLSNVFGIQQLITGINSGHLAEFLGESQPRFELRPLWVGCDRLVKAAPEVTLAFPHSLVADSEKIHPFCQRILDLGYNGVLFGARQDSSYPIKEEWDISSLFDVVQQHGLKVIVKPSTAKEDHLDTLFHSFPSIDYLFWETPLKRADGTKTLLESHIEEMKRLEKACGQVGLIYFIPAADKSEAEQQAQWLPWLCDEAGERTILAFPAVAGQMTADFLQLHPFWNALRASPDTSSTPLMPIVNCGALKQGEGLWPVLNYDLIERFFERCYRHHFAGIMTLVNQLPQKRSMLDCCLWIASQAQWGNKAPLLLAETWFLANRPDIDFAAHASTFREIRNVSLQLAALSTNSSPFMTHEECRFLTESLLSRIKEIHIKLVPSLRDSFTFFERDARRIILRFLQKHNSGLANLLMEDSQGESFWTQMNKGNVLLLEEPLKGAPGSLMEQIYKENRF